MNTTPRRKHSYVNLKDLSAGTYFLYTRIHLCAILYIPVLNSRYRGCGPESKPLFLGAIPPPILESPADWAFFIPESPLMYNIFVMEVYNPPPVGDLIDGRWPCEWCGDPDGKWRPRVLGFYTDVGEILCDCCEDRWQWLCSQAEDTRANKPLAKGDDGSEIANFTLLPG